ncbi:MAG: NUDIX domain-containing protein [Patescibacteria group bacterium]|nr:NUDIX domain-containing protein [Patescibacteria group bacterium]
MDTLVQLEGCFCQNDLVSMYAYMETRRDLHSNMKSRIIVSAVIEKNGQFLFGRKAGNIGPYPNTWHLLGGGVNIGEESLEAAVRREILEESGIEVNDAQPVFFSEDEEPNKHGEMTRYLFLVYRTQYKSGMLKANDDIRELKWIKLGEFKKYDFARPSVKLFKSLGYL